MPARQRSYQPGTLNAWRARYEWERLGRCCTLCGAKVNSDHYCVGCKSLICGAHSLTPGQIRGLTGRHKVEQHDQVNCPHPEIVQPTGPTKTGLGTGALPFCARCLADVPLADVPPIGG